MISSHFYEKLVNSLGFDPTSDQKALFKAIAEFALSISSKKKEIFVLKGFAGTGKTTVISHLVETLNNIGIKSVLLAPTGRAAKVFSSISGRPAHTIHKKIYRQKSSNDGFGKFILNKNLHKNTIFFIDESSMISNTNNELSVFGSGKLLDDIIQFVYETNTCKLVFIGDVAQLPPVGLTLSPALDVNYLEGYGISCTEIVLKEVVRQSKNSDILKNATLLREDLSDSNFLTPRFELKNNSDVERINGTDLIESISNSYDKNGISSTIVVCRSNKRANKYNEGIRQSILWSETEISLGDLMMVVKNNYYWVDENEDLDFIANGDIFEITRIKNYEERYGFRFANVSARFIDYKNVELDLKIFLDTIMIEKASFSQEENKELYYNVLEDYSTLKTKKQQYDAVKNNPFFNALQVKFAYAVTCHKAQGGQWENVFVDQGYFKDDMVNEEYLRWLYTAITRTTQKLYLVNFPNDFFEENEY